MKTLRSIAATLLCTLREIFDENAYRRFLEREGLSLSCASYASFLREQETASLRKPRCC